MFMPSWVDAFMSPSNAPKSALSSERAAKLKLAQLEMVVRNIKPGVIGLPGLAVTIAFVLSEWVSVSALTWWVASVIVATAFYWAGHQAFLRHGTSRPDLADQWTWILGGQQLVFSTIWNLPPVLFWAECPDMGRMFLIMVYACNMAGGAAITSPSPPYAAISI